MGPEAFCMLRNKFLVDGELSEMGLVGPFHHWSNNPGNNQLLNYWPNDKRDIVFLLDWMW